jgi:hypothetical protein
MRRMSSATGRIARNLLAAAKHAVLVDLQAAVLRHAPEVDVVGLAAGEIMQRRAKRARLGNPQVDLQATVQDHRHSAGAFSGPGGDLLIPVQRLDHGRGIAGADQEIQVANRLAAPAIAAGHDHLLDARHLAQVGHQRFGELPRHGPQPALFFGGDHPQLSGQAFVQPGAQAADPRQGLHLHGPSESSWRWPRIFSAARW